MGLITESNEEYYAGEKVFLVPTDTTSFATTFNTELQLSSSAAATNFVLQISSDSGATYQPYTTAYPGGVITLSNDNRTVNVSVAVNGTAATLARIVLKANAVYNNYGGYSYVTLKDIVNTFIATYVGTGKLVPSVKRTDVIFHAKRGLQEFSYDNYKSYRCSTTNG